MIRYIFSPFFLTWDSLIFLDLCLLLLLILEKYSAIIPSDISIQLFSLPSPSGVPITSILNHLILSPKLSDVLDFYCFCYWCLFFSPSLFSLCVSVGIISADLFSSSLILSSVTSSCLISLLKEFFNSDAVGFFISRIFLFF